MADLIAEIAARLWCLWMIMADLPVQIIFLELGLVRKGKTMSNEEELSLLLDESRNVAIDTPRCCGCMNQIDLDEGCFYDVPINHLSGASEIITCSGCGQKQTVSPSIEWQTESVDDE